ncbi:MAG TPA: RHS repeat-associated core domain-containing protein [Herpetosiphonaceae bacterium]
MTIPATNASSSVWKTQSTQPDVNIDTKALAGKTGWIQVEKTVGQIDHVVALDNIQIYLDGKPIPLPADQLLGKCRCNEGGVAQHTFGDPVNTYSGAYYLQATDLTAPSSGPPLAFERSYASLVADPAHYPTSTLGPGWWHTFAEQLVMSGTGSEANTIIYEAATGNRLRFYRDAEGRLYAAPGVRATLEKVTDPLLQQQVYLLRNSDQWLKIFDVTTGRLIERRDPAGHRQILTYYTTPGQIEYGQVQDVSTLTPKQAVERTLHFTYGNYNGPRLVAVEQVPDATTSQQKRIAFSYTPTGTLASVRNLHGGTTEYTYKQDTFLLEGVIDPFDTRVLTNTYDNDNRVSKQVEHTGLTTTYTYVVTGGARTTTIQQWPTPATQEPASDILVDHYRADGTLEYQTRNGVFQRYMTFDNSLTPAVQVDGRGSTTKIATNSSGLPTSIAAVLNKDTDLTTTVRYDVENRPLEMVSPDGLTTSLTYDDQGNLTRSLVQGPDGLQLTSIYTYTLDNRLQSERRPDGVVTSYTYNQHGQVIRTIVNEQPGGVDLNQPDKHLVTEYGYDSFGRLITTTVGVGTPLARTDTTSYNADDTIAQTIQNYKNGHFDPGYPDEDVVTTYGYDLLGRRIFVTDVLGHSDVTIYTPTGRVATTIRNCYDAGHTPATTGCVPFDPAFPDRNVATRYGYDNLGRTAFITETGILTGTFNVATQTFSAATERTTHIEYDQFSRPVTTTLNYQPAQPIYDPTTGSGYPDVNLQELSYYDGAGNVTWQRDVVGRWTKTEYDALNRPVRTIANYEDGNPSTVQPVNQISNGGWTDGSDTDIITEQEYRSDGQLARRIDNAIKGSFSVNDPAADRITTYQYDTLGRLTTTIQNVLVGSARTDTNRASTTRYEPQTGRVQGQQDALGQWLRYRYDALSRVTATIQNCRAADGGDPPGDCTDAAKPSERNVRSLTRYDALGRVVETEDALGHITHIAYDGLGRTVATTANAVPNVAPDADTNVMTSTEYDALGRVVAVTDPTGAVTRTEYDALGRAVTVTDAAGRVTRQGYDGSGILRWTMSHDGRLTVFQVDSLGRTVTTIANYHNGTVDAADGVDRDVIATTSYDVAGRTIETIETARQITTPPTAGRRTAFRYDLRDQLTQVIENYHPQCSTLPAEQQPCNVTTSYTYDRAGNRTAVTDALNHTRTMVYDAADRQTEERDALNRATGWEYNERDQPTRKRDPRGSAYDVTYTYDELGRRTGTSAPQLDAPIAEQYDVLGRRTQLQDGTGTTRVQYDDLSRVTSVQQPGGTVGYRYTPRGARSELRYPSGATVAYAYTVDGQLESVHEGATTLARYSYDGVGRLAQVARANGALTTYAYDGLDRLFDLTTRAQGELRSRYQYTLDRAGLRTAVTETFPPDTSSQSVLLHSSTGSSAIEPSPARSLNQIAFVPSQGQTDGRVAFVVRHQDGTIFLMPQGLTLSLPVAAPGESQAVDDEAAGTDVGLPRDRRQTAVGIEWVRANPRPTLTPAQALPGTVNDLRGSTPARWQRNLPTYGGVTYAGLYAGIDLRYDGTQGTLKGTYTVAPGADPKQIRWRYAGATAVQLTENGDIQVHLAAPADHAAPTLTEAAPIAWQDGPSGRTPVAVSYTVDQDGSVGFVLGTYDATQPLTIDPTLTWSTTLSGSGSEEGRGIAVASDGSLMLTGATTSADFPQNLGVQPVGHHGGYDAFVTKLSADGAQVLWQTFLGGSAADWGQSLALDSQNRPVIVGRTASTNLPTTANAVQSSAGAGLCAGVPCFDAFIARLSADGSTLQYSSYLGGSKQDQAQRVALASDGSAVLVGETASSTFPTTIGAVQTVPGEVTCEPGLPCTDAFITRIDPSAATGAQALRWSTRFGGAGADSAWGVAIDSAGEVLVTGTTESATLPLANAYDPHMGGMSDAFVAKLSGDGTQVRWGTYLGSTDTDVGRDVAVDGAGDVYVTGWTSSLAFPTTPGALQSALAGANDAFVTRLSGDGTRLRWSTLVGGRNEDYSTSFTVAADGTSTLVGSTSSVDLPTIRPLQTSHAGPSDGQDLLVAMLKPDGSTAHLVSYLGSSSDDRAWDVAAAGNGSVRITGYTGAASLPGGSPPPGGTSNAFVVALDGLTTPGGEPAVEQRAVSYSYDPLQRLTEATETLGTSYRYAYDLVGNRTDVWKNGVQQPTVSYDAANQVVGFSYDAAGNLLNDGTRTLTYDALNRLTSAMSLGSSTTSYRYSGDGMLASQTMSGVTTTYSQDRVAPLNQVLEITAGGTTTTYRYGHQRLAEVKGSTRTWYGSDILGSVRQTLSDTGTAAAPIHYDPWGKPSQGTPPTFGFTGELQDASGGLVHLRARWYLPEQAAFASRDPFAGFPEQPYSLHPYQYGYNNPILYTDPTGQNPAMCLVPVVVDGLLPFGDAVAAACLLAELSLAAIGYIAGDAVGDVIDACVVPDVDDTTDTWPWDPVTRPDPRIRPLPDRLVRPLPVPTPQLNRRPDPTPQPTPPTGPDRGPVPVPFPRLNPEPSPTPTVTPTTDNKKEWIYRRGEVKPQSVHLRRPVDFATGLSFETNKPAGSYLKYDTAKLRAHGFVVRPDHGGLVIALPGKTLAGLEGKISPGQTYSPGHVTVYMQDMNRWDAWYQAEQVARLEGRVTQETQLLFSLREPTP